jgi:hypothetical protein
MRKALVAVLLFSGVVSFLSAAAADDKAAKPASGVKKMKTDDCARARAAGRTCIIDISEGEEVVGDLPKGTDTIVSIPGFTDHSKLFTIRYHFLPEIVKSAEDI